MNKHKHKQRHKHIHKNHADWNKAHKPKQTHTQLQNTTTCTQMWKPTNMYARKLSINKQMDNPWINQSTNQSCKQTYKNWMTRHKHKHTHARNKRRHKHKSAHANRLDTLYMQVLASSSSPENAHTHTNMHTHTHTHTQTLALTIAHRWYKHVHAYTAF